MPFQALLKIWFNLFIIKFKKKFCQRFSKTLKASHNKKGKYGKYDSA